MGRFPAHSLTFRLGQASPAQKHRRHSALLSSIPVPLSPREQTLCFRVSVQGLVQHDMISDHQKLAEAHICLSAWWAQTLKGQLSASEIVRATVIPDIKGFLTYIQSPEQLPHPLPQRSLKPSACPEIDAEPQTVRSDFVVWNPNHAQLASETSGTNVTLLQQDIFVFDKY